MRNRQKRSIAFTALIIAVITVVVACFTACGTVHAPSSGNNNNNNNNNNDTYCVVAFYSNGGSAVQAQQVDIGGKVSRPAEPIREGFDFGGWYKDRNLQNEWNFDTDTVSGTSLTLYAKWTEEGSDVPLPI
ncbi:MAG: InlB B-repeat-containing protein, partial [Clostridiales bacterium]|nr:InlB B-repeat-containing protein [Clostridiales bacterium]